ncbi:hypothetical protein [Hymenobacter guriensis]|uniref:Uncharacterized protein n=1 Tax=Hymenobacter guriensis TaxID=2793065 RepID=A0ABS0KWW1_9BACT|nr:hypothetical protein [Hymenobacter guriensis]MBG8552341.1 hypothetical protein [Hymenobacter guriensis]
MQPHQAAERVAMTIDDFWCTLLSGEGRTELPCESRGREVTTTVDVQRLITALESIEDQPITLDLHQWRGAKNVLYACRFYRSEYSLDRSEPIQFDI